MPSSSQRSCHFCSNECGLYLARMFCFIAINVPPRVSARQESSCYRKNSRAATGKIRESSPYRKNLVVELLQKIQVPKAKTLRPLGTEGSPRYHPLCQRRCSGRSRFGGAEGIRTPD